MKPKPFSALNHFTVPCATCAPAFVRRTTLPDRRAGFLLFRPSNTNVELNRAERYNKKPGKTGLQAESIPRRVSADQARSPRGLERGVDAVGRADHRLQRIEGLKALPRVQDDGLLGLVQSPVLDQLTQHRDGHATRGLGEDARRAGEVADALHDLVVAHPADGAAGAPDRVE